ncbi:hypothetical protein J8F10_13570 [Gemmata sp. G18]|uniref:Uncharacterized protein n=1 Tax=Gemmata palustris TaxID=2822762 RepID=A0ABS5BRJ3_9BACT|nr:hypothetical protein [Gemmata palustris]MBP3956314.1 hypothetical protein [Gemmata palustris]
MDANEAREQIRQAIARASKSAANDIANGADPSEVARQTARIVDALDGDEKIEHLLAVIKQMDKASAQQALAALKAIDEDDDQDEDAPEPAPAVKPKKKKPKR